MENTRLQREIEDRSDARRTSLYQKPQLRISQCFVLATTPMRPVTEDRRMADHYRNRPLAWEKKTKGSRSVARSREVLQQQCLVRLSYPGPLHRFVSPDTTPLEAVRWPREQYANIEGAKTAQMVPHGPKSMRSQLHSHQ